MAFQVPAYVERLVPYIPGKPLDELERELGIKNAIKLASNENLHGPAPEVIAAFKSSEHLLHYYPDAAGFRLREAIGGFLGVPVADVVLGNGSNELIDLIARTFVSPDDHAVFGDPSFVCYRMCLSAANVPFTEVPLRESVSWNVDDLLAAVEPRTKVMFVANPNNPTGAHIGSADLRRLISELPQHVMLVMDEAYIEYAGTPDLVSALTMRHLRENICVLRTFSKAYGLAAIRVGYGVMSPEAVGYLDRVRAPFNCNAIGQHIAITALAAQHHIRTSVAQTILERERVASALASDGLLVAPSQTNFILVNVNRPGRVVYEAMLRQGVIVRPMPPPISTWLRITVGLPSDNDRMLASLSTALKGIK